MITKLFTHEFPLKEEISTSLNSGKYSDFKAAIAYVKLSGVNLIYDDLITFSKSGGKTSIISGIDQSITSYQALINLLPFTNDSFYIHHDKNFDISFHPKLYLFGNDEVEKIIIGSSNLTAGGLYLNYEINVSMTISQDNDGREFIDNVTKYWNDLIADENTKKADITFLNTLLKFGTLADEKRKIEFSKIIEKVDGLPFISRKKARLVPPINKKLSLSIPSRERHFAMTLSHFDVSDKSSDPVILIPLAALSALPDFWNWPNFFTDSGSGYPQLYAKANIKIDGQLIKDQHIRIYYYDRKSEFRLQCEQIKRNGNQGDIVLISKHENDLLAYDIELIRQGSEQHLSIIASLENKVSQQKWFDYF